MQQDLFSPERRWQEFDLPDADVKLLPAFLGIREQDALFCELRDDVAWRQDKITVYGKTHDVPRLQQWYGDPGLTYTWSGIEMKPEPWLPSLLKLRREVEGEVGVGFNTALLNYYRNGADTVGWHADDERVLGPSPPIASVSLGAERDFVLRRNVNLLQRVTITLRPGDLLVMAGTTQAHWKHSLPRRVGAGGRINVTFRKVYA